MQTPEIENWRTMPVIHQGQYDNLVLECLDCDNVPTKIWVSRLTTDDGAPHDEQVTCEKYRDGAWVTHSQS